MSGRPTDMASYSPRWIIDKTGITVGLTDSNWSPFSGRYINLSIPSHRTRHGWPGQWSCPYLWQWGEMEGFYDVADNRRKRCTILIDMGIEYGSIRSHEPLPARFSRDPRSHQLDDREEVEVQFGPYGLLGTCRLVIERFKIGSPGIPDQACGSTPDRVNVYEDTSRPSFINTGRHMLRKWRMAFDAVHRRIGFAPASTDPGVCILDFRCQRLGCPPGCRIDPRCQSHPPCALLSDRDLEPNISVPTATGVLQRSLLFDLNASPKGGGPGCWEMGYSSLFH